MRVIKVRNMREVGFNFKGRDFEIECEECSAFGMIRGLMFRSREKSPTLLFNFNKDVLMPIHSWFVFFPFVGVWLDENNQVIQVEKVGKFRSCISPKNNFRKLIEIPINNKNSEIVGFLVGDSCSSTEVRKV